MYWLQLLDLVLQSLFKYLREIIIGALFCKETSTQNAHAVSFGLRNLFKFSSEIFFEALLQKKQALHRVLGKCWESGGQWQWLSGYKCFISSQEKPLWGHFWKKISTSKNPLKLLKSSESGGYWWVCQWLILTFDWLIWLIDLTDWF